MTLARARLPTWAARPATWKASSSTYTPPWKYRTTWRGSTPSTVISAVGMPPSAAAVTVTSAGSGCADSSSRSSRRCTLTSLPAGKADCRKIASRVSRCSVLTEDLPSVGWFGSAPGSLAHVSPLLKFPAGRRAAASLAARQVRRRHRIMVIYATGDFHRDCGIMPDGRGLPWLVRLAPRHVPGRAYPADLFLVIRGPG